MIALLAVPVAGVEVHALAQGPSSPAALPFCGLSAPLDTRFRPRLLPRDEAARHPDFLAFRRQLGRGVLRRDRAAILRIAEPDVNIDFEGEGIEFLKAFIDDAGRDFWGEFGRALAMGGTFDGNASFSTPYVYSAWADRADSVECKAVTGTGVRLREQPSAGARVLASLDFDIVERVDSDRDVPGWEQVRLSTGLKGYVASGFIRSPIDYRAWFVLTESGWRLKAFVIGD
ncbi:SH3 domain-containing protein [Luteitalea pratensis]|uniref:SH3 domain-containing protein n=1 Tax=Luteitalea pratensis TaxID=1855912 RepID=UPI0012FFA144|nr:SH3 domain-containing protein [Luteitalea pratensis]